MQRADFVCGEGLLIGLKALDRLSTIEHARIINYPKATGFKRGSPIYFRAPRFECKRFIHTRPEPKE